jgi:hypothetical protein
MFLRDLDSHGSQVSADGSLDGCTWVPGAVVGNPRRLFR